MAGRLITLKYAGKCNDCGSKLAVGEKARWYSRGIVYGIVCHDSPDGLGVQWDNKRGVAVGRSGRCEDAPCCGCCDVG